MRRFPTLALAMVVATTLGATAACSTDTGNKGGGSDTITVLHTPDDRAALDAAVAAFEKANPGKKIKVSYVNTDQLGVTLQSQLSSGNAADVLPVQPGIAGSVLQNGVLVKGGYLTDVSDRPWAKKLPDTLKQLLLVDGKLYQLPPAYLGIGAIYNTDAVKAAGLTAPQTYPQVLQFCRGAKAKGKVAYSLGIATQFVTQLIPYAFAATTVFAKDPDFSAKQRAGKVTFSDSGWRTAYEQYQQMDRAGCFNKDPLGTSIDVSLPAVAKGDALGVVQVGSQLGALEKQAPDVSFEMLPLPGTSDASQTWVTASPAMGYGIYAKSGKKALAGKFLDFLAQPAVGNAYAKALGALPALPNDSFTPEPAIRSYAKYIEDGRTTPFPGNLWPNPKVQQTNFDSIQALFLGRLSVTELLAALDKAYVGK